MKSEVLNVVSRFYGFDQLTKLILIVIFSILSVIPVFLMPWYYSISFYISACVLSIFFIKPKWGTYSLILLIPFSTVSFYFLISAKWNFFIGQRNIDLLPFFAPVVLITYLGFIIRKLTRIEQGTTGNLITIPIFIVLVYSCLTMFWSDFSGHNTAQFLILAMNVAIFMLIVSFVKNENDLYIAVWFWIFSALIQALSYYIFFFLNSYHFKEKIFEDLVFGMSIIGGYLQPSGDPNVDGGFMDHHELTLMMNLALAVTFGLFMTKPQGLKRIFLLMTMFIFILATLRTESRAGIVSMLLMVFFILLIFNMTRRYFIRISIIFGTGVAALYIFQAAMVGQITNTDKTPRLIFLGSKMVETKDAIDPGLKEKTGRMRLWKKSFKKYKKYWIQGFGVGNLKKFLQAPHAHSVFLSFMFDFGLIGLISVIYIVYSLIKRFIILIQHQTSYINFISIAFGTGLFVIGLHGQADFEYNTTLLWLYLGLTVSSFRISYQEICKDKYAEEMSTNSIMVR